MVSKSHIDVELVRPLVEDLLLVVDTDLQGRPGEGDGDPHLRRAGGLSLLQGRLSSLGLPRTVVRGATARVILW